MATLSKKNKQILTLRMNGLSLEEIAQQIGYKTQSAVLKRIRKIGQAYERFAGIDFSFDEKKIV